MYICFLDIMGFSLLVTKNRQDALNKLKLIKERILLEFNQTDTFHKHDYESLCDFRIFTNVIFISDSLIITGEENKVFFEQLAKLVINIFNETVKYIYNDYEDYSKRKCGVWNPRDEQFLQELSDSRCVEENILKESLDKVVLFRGGLARYNDDVIQPGIMIVNNELLDIITVCGEEYQKAYMLENNAIIGPSIGIFKDEIPHDLNILFTKGLIKENSSFDKEIYEFLWPYYAFSNKKDDKLIDKWASFTSGKKIFLKYSYNLINKMLEKTREQKDTHNDKTIISIYKSFARLIVKSLEHYKQTITLDEDAANDFFDLLINEIDEQISKFKSIK